MACPSPGVALAAAAEGRGSTADPADATTRTSAITTLERGDTWTRGMDIRPPLSWQRRREERLRTRGQHAATAFYPRRGRRINRLDGVQRHAWQGFGLAALQPRLSRRTRVVTVSPAGGGGSVGVASDRCANGQATPHPTNNPRRAQIVDIRSRSNSRQKSTVFSYLSGAHLK